MTLWIYLLQPAQLEMVTHAPAQLETDAVFRHFNYLKDLTQQGVGFWVDIHKITMSRPRYCNF